MDKPTVRLQRTRAGFTLLELMLVVTILGLLAAAAVPSYVRYLRRMQTSEATLMLRKVFDGAAVYFAAQPADIGGDQLQHQFPVSAPPMPAITEIGTERVRVTSWDGSPTWDALHFSMADPHYYAYQFDASGFDNDAQFTASAFGNLDGDDTFSTFVRFGSVHAMSVHGSQGVFMEHELE